MVRSAAAMEAGQVQVPDGRALAAVVVSTSVVVSGGGAGGGREPEGLPCPRCESVVTKFCYYNNYNLSQPRYFCKTCRRYWTRGGALRNVPVGGGTRKATPAAAAARRKRSASAAAAPPSSSSPPPPPLPAPPVSLHGGGSLLRPYGGYGGGGAGGMSFVAAPPISALASSSPLNAVDHDGRLVDLGGSFTSLIAPAADVGVHFSAGFFMGGFAPGGLLPRAPGPASVAAALPTLMPPPQQQAMVSQQQALPEGMFWNMGWPDLSI